MLMVQFGFCNIITYLILNIDDCGVGWVYFTLLVIFVSLEQTF